jgi:oxygen-dependent protoporphyrinogen oxidase
MLIGPMVSGIFAGDPETMSLQSCFPRIRELEQEYGGLLRAMIKLAKQKKAERKAGKEVASAAGPGGVLTSFVDGIQTLTEATSARLAGTVRISAAVVSLRPHDGGWELKLASGEKLDAELVVSAAPAHVLGELLRPLDSQLADLVDGIPYAAMNVICFGYARERIARDLGGFGYLIPRKEGRSILGTLWDSSIFPQRAPEGHVLLRSMMGGATNPAAADFTDDEIMTRTQADLREIMGITAKPDFVRIFRHPLAIPQYLSGHAKRLTAVADRLKDHPGLFVTGNAFFGVGLNDCVHAANRAAEQVTKQLSVGK